MTHLTTSQEFFEHIYRSSSDPWNFSSSSYELARYQAVMQALGQRRWRRAFEPGCSIGVLTAHLAGICDEVVAIDISPTAAKRAQERCRGLANVHIACETLGPYLPGGCFDLVIMSEIGYYFEQVDLEELMQGLLDRMNAGATLLACHWLGFSPDHLLSGDDVHDTVLAVTGLVHTHARRHPGFRLDVWEKS